MAKEEEQEKPYGYYTERRGEVHHIYFSEPIGEPSSYIDLVHKIRGAPPDDIIVIHLNTPGGNLETGVQIINAMRESAAHVVTSIESTVSSLGTMIFLSGHEMIIHDDCLFMIHNYSGGTWGKGHEQMARLEGDTKWTNALLRKVYMGFLSEDEFDRMRKGEDFYFSSEEVRKRVKKFVKYMTDKHKELERKEMAKLEKQAQK